MKKLLCVLAMGAIVFGFASCKRNCVCTVTFQDDTSTTYSQGTMSAKECGNQTDKITDKLPAGTYKKIDCRQN